jgi:hypothetical protein
MGKAARIQNREVRRPTPAQQRRSVWNKRFGVAQMLMLAAVIAVIAIAVSIFGSSSGKMLPWSVFTETDHQHVTGNVSYDHSPPAGGAHDAVWLNCGVYPSSVRSENAVHALEHGSVWLTYDSNATASQIALLTSFVQSHYLGTERYLLLSPYPSQSAHFIATAWGAQLSMNRLNFAQIAKFVAYYQGGNQGGEKGASCSGGTGTPSS